MTGEKNLLLWALENTTKEPMCDEAEGSCDFTFEIGERELCPCQWRVVLQAERKASVTGSEPESK